MVQREAPLVALTASGPSGIIERPDSPARATHWECHGELIVVTHAGGTCMVRDWPTVNAALEGNLK
ncbi:MAG: hypothetical protein F4213_19205 [Boseongicola sp. SB0677_bin_26]|nr:hypothetical protein [Boseongicola sp. SB0677_bin_26]